MQGKPHATFEVAGAGNGQNYRGHEYRLTGSVTRLALGTAPVLDPTPFLSAKLVADPFFPGGGIQYRSCTLSVLRTGCQWNALNATGICSSSAAHRRFQEWQEARVFEEFWKMRSAALRRGPGN